MNKLIIKINKYIEKHYMDEKLIFSERLLMKSLPDSFIDFTEKVQKSFSEILLEMIDERNLQDTYVYKKANIDRRHFSKMRNKDYHPRKNTIIKFIFALELDIDEADTLLNASGYVLSTGVLRDVILMYFIENNIYDLNKVNEVLEHYKLELI